MPPGVRPPETLEGWFATHCVARLDRRAWRALAATARAEALASAGAALAALATPEDGGWSATIPLIGSQSDILLVHVRPSLAQLSAVQDTLGREPLWDYLTPTFTFLSVTEAALYTLSVQLAERTLARGGEIGDATYREELANRLAAETGSPHMHRRLYPELPQDLPYVSFYPMSKRRQSPNNWYTLPLAERDRLMREHGLTGRRFAGRIRQLVTGSIGFEEWEWGVTLFARDPLDLKHIVTEMRYDPASAEFGEFGPFFVGRVCDPSEWLATLAR
jgi:peroxiredoxin